MERGQLLWGITSNNTAWTALIKPFNKYPSGLDTERGVSYSPSDSISTLKEMVDISPYILQ